MKREKNNAKGSGTPYFRKIYNYRKKQMVINNNFKDRKNNIHK